MSNVPSEHRAAARNLRIACAVLTCSDSRKTADDKSGSLIRALLAEAGHDVVLYQIIREDPGLVANALRAAAQTSQAILLTGGTGVSPRDGTVEAVTNFIHQTLPGFGELFRSLSYDEIGSAAMLSRAVAGVGAGSVVFAMPGSTAAVRLAMTKLVIPELRHLVGLLGDSSLP